MQCKSNCIHIIKTLLCTLELKSFLILIYLITNTESRRIMKNVQNHDAVVYNSLRAEF